MTTTREDREAVAARYRSLGFKLKEPETSEWVKTGEWPDLKWDRTMDGWAELLSAHREAAVKAERERIARSVEHLMLTNYRATTVQAILRIVRGEANGGTP